MDPENELTSEDLAAFEAMREADTADSPAEVRPPEGASDPDAGIAAPPSADPADPDGDARSKTVPHGAFHEERERRKDLDRQLAEERATRKVLEERTNLILQQVLRNQQPADAVATAPPAIPAIEQDPVGHIVGQLQRTRGEVELIQQAEAQRAQQAQQQQVIAAITQDAQSAEAQFRQTKPDYDAAVSHLIAGRNRELEISGMTDPAQRQQFLSQEALGIAIRARQMGRSPAEIIYELATQRGYSSAPPAPVAPPALSAAAQVAQINAGQQQARTLGAAAGAAPAELNVQTIIDMDIDKFSKWLTTASRAQKETVFGA